MRVTLDTLLAGGTPGFLSATSDEAAAGGRLRSSGSLEVIMTEVLIPARQGRAVRVSRGAVVDVINTHGSQVVFRAETDLVVIMSACPQDLTPVNGTAQRPADVHFRLHDDG